MVSMSSRNPAQARSAGSPNRATASVQELTAYAATVADRTCSDYLRARYRIRTSLKTLCAASSTRRTIGGVGNARPANWSGYPGWRGPSCQGLRAHSRNCARTPTGCPLKRFPGAARFGARDAATRGLDRPDRRRPRPEPRVAEAGAPGRPARARSLSRSRLRSHGVRRRPPFSSSPTIQGLTTRPRGWCSRRSCRGRGPSWYRTSAN